MKKSKGIIYFKDGHTEEINKLTRISLHKGMCVVFFIRTSCGEYVYREKLEIGPLRFADDKVSATAQCDVKMYRKVKSGSSRNRLNYDLTDDIEQIIISGLWNSRKKQRLL